MSDDIMPDDDIDITAEGATIRVSEKVSTGDSETHTVSTTLEVSIEETSVDEGVPKELQSKLYGLKRTLQHRVRDAADARLGVDTDEPKTSER